MLPELGFAGTFSEVDTVVEVEELGVVSKVDVCDVDSGEPLMVEEALLLVVVVPASVVGLAKA